MNKSKSLYHAHRFPSGVIRCAVRWYFRFNLSLCYSEELLLERGEAVTYESPMLARQVRLAFLLNAPKQHGASRADVAS